MEIEYTVQTVWKDQTVTLTHCSAGDCRHVWLGPMHHLDEHGQHHCPTGFIYCPECGGIGIEPEPYECNGEATDG